MDIESMARYWSQDAENYGDIIRKELAHGGEKRFLRQEKDLYSQCFWTQERIPD